ncbi:NusA-like transcription termination signal-binding factor [Halovenus sp. WSH3]|uniref:Probable transcription termination protein NusA n=1 Tax=Halovenus carboxidivorans TaxID=2692199 RepID=A0A6B0TFM4_9EURY|nr:NusA-like transcription termination signal-binding factor [Halovenus carboxidivorans]MXR51989.1 NusA-like transcription termination signal-binding factor [Halovenus carboxidivorans]
MTITLSDEARQLAGLFETETEATVKDCLLDEEFDRVIFLIKTGEMGKAIGAGGEHVSRVEQRIGKSIKLVEDAPTAEDFVANTLAPAAVYNVTISENDDRLAYVEVAEEDRGAAIGADGRNIDAARRLAERHYDIDDIELT